MKRWTRNPWRRLGLAGNVGWLVAGGYATVGLLVAASSMFAWEGAYATRPVDEVVTALCLVFAAGCAGWAARFEVQRRRRFGWLALMTALLGWAVGVVIWAVYELRPDSPHALHQATAAFALGLYPIGAMAALVPLSHLSRHSPRQLVLDGLIVWTSLFVVSWAFVLDKSMRADPSARLATIVQIFADCTLMTTGILMLSRRRPHDLPSRTLLAAGITTIAFFDIAIVFQAGVGSYHISDLADLGRVTGLGMLALGALSSVNESPTAALRFDITSRLRLWLPYLPLLLAAAVGLSRAIGSMAHGPVLAALGILVVAVLARQFVVLMENQSLLSEVAQEASRDSLTGLANRAQFLHVLEQSVANRRADNASIAVLCLDLDNFKSVNDALGHPAGDELLVRVAERLTTALGEVGTVARLGGDEFAVLIEGSVERSQAAAHGVLDSFTAPIVIDGVPIHVRPSIGFTVATALRCTVDDLLRHADLAMYAAKREGGQCVRSFVPDLPLPCGFAPTDDAPPARAAGPADALSKLDRARNGRNARTTRNARTAKDAKDAKDPPHAIRWPPAAIRVAFAVLALGVLVFTVSSVFNMKSGHAFFNHIMYPALNLSAASLVAVRVWRVAADRSAWALIASAMACTALGDIVYVLWVPEGQSPSVADPVYLAYYPLVYAGLLLLIRARLTRVPVPIRLDSLVCGLTGAAVAAALTAGPIHTAEAHAPATVLVGLIYPLGDLLLLALVAGMLPILGWRSDFRWVLLVAGFTLFAIADTNYLFETSAFAYRVGTLLDACWPVSALLVALASWAPSKNWSSVPPPPRRGLGPYATPVACTIAALAVAVAGHNSRCAVTLAALSLVAVAARFSVTFRDISLLAETHKHAMTDDLTSLPNRRALATALTAMSVPASSRSRQPARAPLGRALLLLELFEFQVITDSVGTHFGDELLCNVADRLSRSVRRGDLLARIGYCEFAVLLAEGSDLIAARAQAGRLLEAMSEPFALDPITVQVDTRIGIALCPDHCDHPQELLNRAETAIPHTKSSKSKIVVYDAAFELYRENDPTLLDELRTALLDGDEVTCHYQPKINAIDGSVHSIEALLRWQHPSRGLLLPEEFLPAAERAGLMRKIANRALGLALGQIQSWRDEDIANTVAVNLSTTNLLDLELVGTIEQLLRIHDLPAEALIVEITESALVDSARSRTTVAALQRLGVRISLDDYGTGWSSLERLQDVSVDELKLDRVFVARLAQDPRSVAIVRSTVALAQSLGADFVAEGVEDEVTLRALRRYGCTITQGFVHTPPLPPDDLTSWIMTHASDSYSHQSHQAAATDV
jgi:diguanylate cyclase (GGDEF)-like protein